MAYVPQQALKTTWAGEDFQLSSKHTDKCVSFVSVPLLAKQVRHLTLRQRRGTLPQYKTKGQWEGSSA